MRLRHLLLALPLALTACGGSSDPKTLIDEGSTAFASQKYPEARSSFQAAVDAIGNDSANPNFEKAHRKLIAATAHLDSGKAKTMLLDFQKSHGDLLDAGEFIDLAGQFGDAGAFTEATALLAEGQKLYPDSKESLDKLGKNLVALAKKAGDAGAVSSLAGLGYVGD